MRVPSVESGSRGMVQFPMKKTFAVDPCDAVCLHLLHHCLLGAGQREADVFSGDSLHVAWALRIFPALFEKNGDSFFFCGKVFDIQ